MDEMIRTMVQVFKELDVNYAIIGGIASSIRGKPRMTMDADVITLIAPEKVDLLISSMKEYGFNVTKSSESKIVSRMKRGLPVKLRYAKRYSVDLRLALYSIDKQTIKRAKPITIFDVELPIAVVEDLIVYKMVRFDEVDQADIKAMLVRNKNKIKIDDIKKATRKLIEETGNNSIERNLNTVISWIEKGS